MFIENFAGAAENKIRSGATISCIVDGITYTAKVRRDDNGSPCGNDEGFWPSLDPKAPGYIGENPARSFEQQTSDCKEVMRRYKARQMVYCGISVMASKNGVVLVGEYICALGGLDVNWPHRDNGYLLHVANGLLRDAKAEAKEVLTTLIRQARYTLAKLKA